eukprot:m.237111 g.237111  ORF g.237111 m.237111 type:complete len:377 (-) comp18949_c0_seq15:130-1260(-)
MAAVVAARRAALSLSWRNARSRAQMRFSSSRQGASANAEQPTGRQLRIRALQAAVPMIGFGFMDNLVMIQAGDLIDSTLGVAFGLPTLIAAAFGQVFSDLAGVLFGGTVDAAVARMGLPQAGLSAVQDNMRITRLASTGGAAVGVVFGLALGMSSLLFMDLEKNERLKRARELSTIFDTVLSHGCQVIKADRATLFLVDEGARELWSRQTVQSQPDVLIRMDATLGLAGMAMQTRSVVNVADAYIHDKFNPEVSQSESNNHTVGFIHHWYHSLPLVAKAGRVHVVGVGLDNVTENHHATTTTTIQVDKTTGYRTRSVLCVPVLEVREGDEEDAAEHPPKVLGVIQLLNKEGGFQDVDVTVTRMLAEHVAIFLRHLG